MTHAAYAGEAARQRSRRRRRRRLPWLLTGVLAAGLAAAASVLLAVSAGGAPARLQAQVESAIARGHVPADIAEFYRARQYQPLWLERSGGLGWPPHLALRDDAQQVLQLAASADGGGSPAFRRQAQRAAAGADLAWSDVLVSEALALQAARLQPDERALAFVDPQLQPSVAAVLDQAAQAPSLPAFLQGARQINPLYDALRVQFAAYKSRWSALPQVAIPQGPRLSLGDRGPRVDLLRRRLGLAPSPARPYDQALESRLREFQLAHGLAETGDADAATVAALDRPHAVYEQLIAANLQRAKAFPPPPGGRFIVVNAPAAELYLYEDGHVRGSMLVGVGTRADPTPTMAGLIRYVVLNPYWNLPVDLVRERVAPQVLRNGPAYVTARHMQVLSDWSDAAQVVDPATVDWKAVAAGRQELRVRQKPGADNMMGNVKFMLPNELGIYLHDTPEKGVFAQDSRFVSAGCIRLADARRLLAWAFGTPAPPAATPGQETVADLPAAIPVYVTYLTVFPTEAGLRFYPDIYGRDPVALSRASETKVS
jgi:murein L,D-transpeptidase YcbB/YkuD